MQNHAADQLHVKVAHLHRPPPGLTHHCKGLWQNLFQRGLFRRLHLIFVRNSFKLCCNPGLERRRLRAQLLV